MSKTKSILEERPARKEPVMLTIPGWRAHAAAWCLWVCVTVASAWLALRGLHHSLWGLLGLQLGVNSPTIKGDTTVVWGVGSFSSGSSTLSSTVTGILQSVRDGLTGEVVEVPDANGFTTAVVLFNHKDECELGVIVQTSAPIFTRGQVLTVGGLTNVVLLDYEKMWENKGVAKYTVKGTAWSGMPSP